MQTSQSQSHSQAQYHISTVTTTAEIKNPNHQDMQYHNADIKTGNFLVQGHHPQSSATEGGGVWQWGKYFLKSLINFIKLNF